MCYVTLLEARAARCSSVAYPDGQMEPGPLTGVVGTARRERRRDGSTETAHRGGQNVPHLTDCGNTRRDRDLLSGHGGSPVALAMSGAGDNEMKAEHDLWMRELRMKSSDGSRAGQGVQRTVDSAPVGREPDQGPVARADRPLARVESWPEQPHHRSRGFWCDRQHGIYAALSGRSAILIRDRVASLPAPFRAVLADTPNVQLRNLGACQTRSSIPCGCASAGARWQVPRTRPGGIPPTEPRRTPPCARQPLR